MKVLITGATGFIGAPLTVALAEAGYPVRAAVRDRRRRTLPPGVEIALLPDLAGALDWTPLVAGVDAVVHLAGIAHVGPEIPDAIYDRVNHLATAALAGTAAKAGVGKLVFMSSTRAQAGAVSNEPLTESAEPHPTDAYGRSKLAAEAAVRASGLSYTILRPALVYGPNPKGNLASLMRLAALPVPVPFGAFSNRRSLLALDNLIAAVRFALEDPRAANETFLVADPDAISVAQLVSLLRGGAGRRPALVPVPPALLSAVLGLIGKRDMAERLAGTLI
ncbi:MAG TPA: NAD-dependent epimerase/dehydratase family protein, partial [Gemmatimonadales bacterium]|nr:NAD-dependent epimerase/dehydratase family protein [Gemmatimonadales bacterium]